VEEGSKSKGHVTEEEKSCRGFKYNGNKNRDLMPRDRWEWRKIVLETRFHNTP
jgi:hypothetical protein